MSMSTSRFALFNGARRCDDVPRVQVAERDESVQIEAQYKQKKSDYENFLTNKFTVEHAVPADKKSYPVRWLIVVMSTMSAFFFSIVLLIAMDKFKEIRQKV